MLQTVLGSEGYKAPELYMGIDYNGPMADIFSSGVVLYLMVLAKYPFPDSRIRYDLNDMKDLSPYE